DFTYIDNVIQMNEKAMLATNPAAVNTVYNTAVGDRTTLNQLVDHLKEILATYDPAITAVEVIHGPNRQGDIPHSLASVDPARQRVGDAPTHANREGLREAVEWYRENVQLLFLRCMGVRSLANYRKQKPKGTKTQKYKNQKQDMQEVYFEKPSVWQNART